MYDIENYYNAQSIKEAVNLLQKSTRTQGLFPGEAMY